MAWKEYGYLTIDAVMVWDMNSTYPESGDFFSNSSVRAGEIVIFRHRQRSFVFGCEVTTVNYDFHTYLVTSAFIILNYKLKKKRNIGNWLSNRTPEYWGQNYHKKNVDMMMGEDVGRSANTKTKSSSNSFLFLFMHALSTYLINGDIIIGMFEFAAAVSNNHIHVHTRMRHISTCSA